VKLRDVMPVVVLLTPRGLWAMNLQNGDDRYIAHFPEDFDRFVNALAKTYAHGMPAWWVKAKLRQLIEYLEVRDAHILDGDLVRVEDGKIRGVKTMPELAKDLKLRVEDGKIRGVKTMPELAKDLKRIYGNDMELFLYIIFNLETDLRRHFTKELYSLTI